MMEQISVTPWGTSERLPNDPSAPLHDCLWQIAQEQAVLEQMKTGKESWQAASDKVSPKDIQKHLDTICDDNNFRRLDGTGPGSRNPHWINPGERITVRIDPKQVSQLADGINSKQTINAYDKATSSPDGKGPDLDKKQALDTWLDKMPQFPKLSEGTRSMLIEAHEKQGMNLDNLAKLGNSPLFLAMEEKPQQELLAVYGTPGKKLATDEVDKIIAGTAGEDSKTRLKVFGSQGVFQMEEPALKNMIERYNGDAELRAAVQHVVGQESYKSMNSQEQAHTLDILGRYSGRKGEGYGEQPTDKRTSVLITLYNEVLSKPGFNLESYGKSDKPETDAQTQAIDNFADNRASEIGGTKQPEPKETQSYDDNYD
jgi:hypothetical protein